MVLIFVVLDTDETAHYYIKMVEEQKTNLQPADKNKQDKYMQIGLRCSAQVFTTWWGGRFEH